MLDYRIDDEENIYVLFLLAQTSLVAQKVIALLYSSDVTRRLMEEALIDLLCRYSLPLMGDLSALMHVISSV